MYGCVCMGVCVCVHTRGAGGGGGRRKSMSLCINNSFLCDFEAWALLFIRSPFGISSKLETLTAMSSVEIINLEK